MKVKVLNIVDKKTFKAVSTTTKMHGKYGKYISINKKYIVDSAESDVEVGQEVEIVSSKPISRKKKWIIKSNKII